MQNASRRPYHLIAKLTRAHFIGSYRTMASVARTYSDAIDALNSLQTPFEVIEARRKAGVRPDAASIKEMETYLHRIGYTSADLDRLNIVHVAGTKGKGSTCAFVDSILREYRRVHGAPKKIGLFISPHLIAVRERIRINSVPISEALFAKYFFQVWDKLDASTLEQDNVPLRTRPIYSRYLTLVSWHAFLQEGVDVAVYETGVGGEYDATNIVERPVATGISTLGIDHVYVLGDTIDKIAWHKAGIMKTGTPAFTTTQVASAAQVLQTRAEQKSVSLRTLDIDPRLDGVRIRPDAKFQKRNATLAIALAETALQKLQSIQPDASTTTVLPKEFIDGLEKTLFRGRCEVKVEDRVVWYVDGAHTADSLKVSAQWFVGEAAKSPGPRILVFNQQGRTEAIDFLQPIYEATKRAQVEPSTGAKLRPAAFDHVVFCSNVTYAETGYKRDFVNNQVDFKEIETLSVQHRFAKKWSELDPAADVRVIRTVEEALQFARSVGATLDPASSAQTYITGSIHLVGGALGILEEADAL